LTREPLSIGGAPHLLPFILLIVYPIINDSLLKSPKTSQIELYPKSWTQTNRKKCDRYDQDQ